MYFFVELTAVFRDVVRLDKNSMDLLCTECKQVACCKDIC